MIDIKKIDWIYKKEDPATEEEILLVEKELDVTLPDVYKELLLRSNGIYGDMATIYSIQELLEINQTYEVQTYSPGYLSIGSDNGGYHLLMKAEVESEYFQLVDDSYGVPSEDDVKDNFMSWLYSEEGDPWRNEN